MGEERLSESTLNKIRIVRLPLRESKTYTVITVRPTSFLVGTYACTRNLPVIFWIQDAQCTPHQLSLELQKLTIYFSPRRPMYVILGKRERES
jgi:hypothetical protein